MLNFKPIQITDKSWIDRYVWEENSPNADYNFGNLFLWDKSFKQQVCEFGEKLFIRLDYLQDPLFIFPIGAGDSKAALEELRQYTAALRLPLTICSVTPDKLELLQQLYPGSFSATPERAYWDYLYDAEKLCTLSGKKLHGQRNHCNHFESANEWLFRPMQKADFPVCQQFLNKWIRKNVEDNNEGIFDEYDAIERAFSYYDELHLDGGVLIANGEMCAFTIGEVISGDTYDVHFEKAIAEMNGAYSMINREFVKYIRQLYPRIQWINREDDTGREDLRIAKEGYHPEKMVEKYTVVFHND